MSDQTKYLTETQVSELTSIKKSTLRNHRFNCIGIPYSKIGKMVRYSEKTVLEYMDSHTIQTGGENAQ